MIRVGVIGLGMMGRTHLECYSRLGQVKIVAVADREIERMTSASSIASNIGGVAGESFDLSKVKKYMEATQLIEDPEVDLVDICVPTPLHVSIATSAICAGKKLLLEKPTARTAKEALALAELAEKHQTLAMPALCMRFWPGWTWLKQTVDERRYGAVLSAHFSRFAKLLPGNFYRNGAASGGAILDLHLHDTDFITWCFGMPRAVTSYGHTIVSGEVDHVITNYEYPNSAVITSEGGWNINPHFPFSMGFRVIFEKATAIYDINASSKLTVYEEQCEPIHIELDNKKGYDLEIEYLLSCIQAGLQPKTVSLRDAANSLLVTEAESTSVREHRRVSINPL